jgi:hypothetical protein
MPDPQIRITGFRILLFYYWLRQKMSYFQSFFAFYFYRYIYLLTYLRTVPYLFCLLIEGSGSVQIVTDPDPGGPEAYW